MIICGWAFATFAQRQRKALVAIAQNETRLRLVEQVGKTASFERWLSEDKAKTSPELNRLYGFPPGQSLLSEEEWIRRLHPADRSRVVASWKRLLSEGGELSTAFRICRTDGEMRWVLMHARLFPEADDQPARVVVVQQDMFDLMSMRDTLIKAETRRDEAVSAMAHRTS